MLKLLTYLIHGCWHDWETMSRNTLTSDCGGVGQRVRLRCTKCGNWKKKDLI